MIEYALAAGAAILTLGGSWMLTHRAHVNSIETFCSDDKMYVERLNDIASTVYPYKKFFIQPGLKSLTINKNQIFVCTRDPQTDTIYPFDALLYVTLHEMAHAISTNYSPDHTDPEFIKNFEYLLARARQLGLLTKNVNIPKNYCGGNN